MSVGGNIDRGNWPERVGWITKLSGRQTWEQMVVG